MRKRRAYFIGAVVWAAALSALASEDKIQKNDGKSTETEITVSEAVERIKKKPVGFELSTGVSYWAGDVTYDIGGRAWDNSNNRWYSVEDPISELVFPLDVVAVNIEANLTVIEMFEVYAGVDVAVTDPDSKMEDSDWQYGQKVIYSESDSTLDAWNIDAGLRYWAYTQTFRKPGISIGAAPGIGYMKQNMEWTVKNLDQWYPTRPDLPHDIVPGEVLTYDYEMDMLYLSANTFVRYRFFEGSLSGGYSVYMKTKATDDHILRYKKSTSDFDGNAFFVEGEGRFYFAEPVFLLLKASYMYSESDGLQEQEFYAGENAGWRAKIDSEIASDQITGVIGIGFEI